MPATKRQTAKDGQVWANLCERHAGQLSDAITTGDAKKILAFWVAAHGGSKKMVERF